MAERPREKLLERGASTLSDAELLAVLIRAGRAGQTALDVARGLLAAYGGLRALLAAEPATLFDTPGLGPAKVAQLHAALEIGRRHLAETVARGVALESSRDTRNFLTSRLRDLDHEVFCALFLDNRHRILAFEELFRGTLNGTAVYPREVVRRALHWNAAAVIFAHNHPSGVAEPSRADEILTERLKEALDLVEIRVLDHFVVGDGDPVSFHERGLI